MIRFLYNDGQPIGKRATNPSVLAGAYRVTVYWLLSHGTHPMFVAGLVPGVPSRSSHGGSSGPIVEDCGLALPSVGGGGAGPIAAVVFESVPGAVMGGSGPMGVPEAVGGSAGPMAMPGAFGGGSGPMAVPEAGGGRAGPMDCDFFDDCGGGGGGGVGPMGAVTVRFAFLPEGPPVAASEAAFGAVAPSGSSRDR